jgi:AraC-like DNA-binding protein
MTGLCPDINRAAHPGPMTGVPKLVSEEKSRSWGLMSVGVFRRAPGAMVWSSDYYRNNQPLTEIAQQVGLCDQSHLTSIFRRATGEKPGRYRAALA